MPTLKYDSQRENICIKILLFCLFIVFSAFSDEELVLDEIEESKIESIAPRNNTPVEKKAGPKLSQPETTASTTPAKEDYSIKASKFLLEKKYSQATTILWTHIENLTESDLVLLTKAHYLNKEYFESMKAAHLVLAKNEHNFEALTYLGLCQLRKKKDREAKDYFRRATDVNPAYMPAINGLVEIYEKGSNFYELRLIYQDLIKRVGEKSEFVTKLCDINTKDGITDQAQTYCRKAIQLDPAIPENYSNLGLVYKNINDHTKAKEQLRAAADKFPKSDINQLNYAQFLEEQKNFIDAFKYYGRCVKINDFAEKCWLGYTVSSYQIQKFAETLVGLKKSCAFNKKHSFIGRKAASFARSAKQGDWAKKIDSLSELCGN
ncbi:MAG: tetratricopeptide repeat protein [Bdellovibrionaceae bacterium]|nr:tetratricopeptide repeat protein [Pseudobdellovibrionaceae bacterium]